MGQITKISGVYTLQQKGRITNITAGINPLDAVNMAQFNSLQDGTIDLSRIELADSGTAAAPVITWDGDTDTGIYRIAANAIGISANGALVADIRTTGVAVTGAFSASTTVTSTTGMIVGTDITGVKEVNHTITVATTTTSATAGGNLTVLGATGATSGAGGDVIVTGGTGGATAASVGGAITITTGVSGAGGGASGVLSAKSGIGTTATGTASYGSGAASGGTSGNVTLSSGTGTTATGTVIVSTSNATTTAGALTVSTGTAATTGGLIRIDTGAISAGTSAAVQVTSGTGTTGTGLFGVTTGNASAGASGAITLTSGTGTTGTGAFLFTSGNASAGGSGAAGFTTGTGTTTTGAITLATGNASAGTAGNIVLSPGTSSSTTVAPVVIVNGNEITKPVAAPFFLIGTTASDGAFAKSIVGGYVEIRGATGNVQLPTGAMITTAIGTVTSGTSFKCIFNAIGATPMTAGNTATITTNTNAVLDATLDQDIVTITSTSNVNIGTFQFTWDSANWIVSRV